MFYSKHIFLCGKIGTALNITASGMFLRKNWKISIDYFSESCCILLSFSIMCGIIDKLCGRLPTCSLRLCHDQGTIEEEKKNGNLARLPAWQQGIPESSSPPPHVGCSQVVTSAGIHCKRENGPGNHFKPCKASQTSLTAQEHQCPPSQNALQWEQVVNQNRILFISKQL